MKIVGYSAKKCATVLCLTVISLIAVLVIRTLILFSQPSKLLTFCDDNLASAKQQQHHRAITDQTKLINRFVEALRFQTVTKAPQHYDRSELHKYIQFLKQNYVLVHSSKIITLEVINELSLLYTIKGTNASLKPYLLLAHLDVVPAEENKWDVPPFNGTIKDGFIYGRGTVDVKNVVMGILESLEFLLETNFQFERSVYIAFGHDEEGRGLDGAKQIASYFLRKGVDSFEFIVDEGTFIYYGLFPGIKYPIAMIGVSEKGLVNIKLTANGVVGHSSVPPKETAIVKLSKAVSKLNSLCHPNSFGKGPERDMIESMAAYASFYYKVVFANLWLFGPIVSKLMEFNPLLNSYIRTSTAVTIFNSGVKDNVLPGIATATVNHRVHPFYSVSDVLNFDRQLINDKQIKVEILGTAIEPHPISPYDENSFGYQTIKKSILEVFDNVAVVPGIMLASTDTRWYLNFTRSIYRFTPAMISSSDLPRIHGHNERISIDNYVKLVNFYHHLMISSNNANLTSVSIKDEL